MILYNGAVVHQTGVLDEFIRSEDNRLLMSIESPLEAANRYGSTFSLQIVHIEQYL